MILLLGKNDAVERYAKEMLNIDLDNDIAYYPDVITHYSELSQWVELARRENPPVVTTQRLDMINEFLHSDLDLKVITAVEIDGNIRARVVEKEKALYIKEDLGLELRWIPHFLRNFGGEIFLKVVGNKENVNQIKLTHKGLNIGFNCFMKPLPYTADNIDISKPERIEITFKDSYEIDNLIHILEKFKKECSEYIGEWR